ncbi:MAG: sensor domain-containing protein [Thermoleophilia bacterium]|jgi:signal transduction histidine kinase|nr:sensor domain-containing protein [Thermoleophilia bacterium]
MAPALRALWAPDTWRRTLYAVAALATGVVWFTVLVTVLSTGAGLLVTLVGLPILWLGMVLARDVMAPLERRWAGWALGTRIPAPPPRRVAGGLLARMIAPLGDPAAWRAVLHGLLLLPLGVLTFTVAVTVWATGLALLTSPAWAWAVDGDVLWDGNRMDTWWEWAGALVLGAGLVLAAPWAVRGVTAIAGAMTRALLGASAADLASENRRLTAGRDAAVDAAAAERRRIERDLHDGTQTQLTALAMDLGQARERLEHEGGDPRALALVASAHDTAKRAMGDLRGIVRGVSPAILADRGLDAALSSLAGASPVPVRLDADLPRRLPAPVESAAYFTASEALANAGRHAGAGRIDLDVRDEGTRLVVEVTDDGRGGAHARPGGGLQGLANRLAAVGGVLVLESPEGGPTRLRAEIPCG